MTLLKDPHARLDFHWDWTGWLADGDTITAAEIVTVTGDGLAVDGDPVVNGPRVTVWLVGGTVPQKCQVTLRVTTAQGRVDDRTMYLQITDR